MTAPQKQVLIIENGPIIALRMWLGQAGIEALTVNTIAEARGYMEAGWTFTGIVIQGWAVAEPNDNSGNIENTLQFLRDLERMQYPGKVYVLSATDFNNPAFRQAAPRALTGVYDKALVLRGEHQLEF